MPAKMRTQINAAADAPFEDLVSGLLTSHGELQAAAADRDTRLNAAAAETTTLTERLNALTAERDAERSARINAILERLVETGRVTKAEADASGPDSITARLNADPDKAVAALLQAPCLLRSSPVKIGQRVKVMTAHERISRINAWVDEHMARTNCSDRAKAWEASKADQEMAALHEAMKEADAARNKQD